MNTPTKTKPETKRERILIVENDIAHYTRKLQKLHFKIGGLENQRKFLREKISRKHTYLLKLHQDPDT